MHFLVHNGYANRNIPTWSTRTTTVTPPPGIPLKQIDKPSAIPSTSLTNKSEPSRSSQNTISSPTKSLMNQMSTLSVSSTSVPATTSSQPLSTVSYQSEYEIMDTSRQSVKKPTVNIASFPPRQDSSLFTTMNLPNENSLLTSTTNSKVDPINDHQSLSLLNKVIKNDHLRLQLNSNEKNKNGIINNRQRNTQIPTAVNKGIRLTNTPASHIPSTMPSM